MNRAIFAVWALFPTLFLHIGPTLAAEKYCYSESGAVAVDVSQPVTRQFLDKAKEIGVSTIIRYYDYDPPTLPEKTLRRQERDQIVANGFDLAVVFQHWNNKFSSFTAERGKGDAERALELARENDQPTDGVIYFGVDGSWEKDTELQNTIAYFKAANDFLKPNHYNVGVYGSGLVCSRLLDQKLAEYCWLANAKSWPGYKDFFDSKNGI